MPRYGGPKKPVEQKKPTLTHFLCLPLINPGSKPQLEESMQRFRESAEIKERASDPNRPEIADTSLPDIRPKAIRPSGTLHLTLNVMSLDKQGLQEAIETLQGLDLHAFLHDSGNISVLQSEATLPPANDTPRHTLDRPITPPPTTHSLEPLKVDFKGLVSMHPPRKTSILYTAPADATNRLYSFCKAIVRVFTNKGLLMETERELILHATIVNTVYAKGKKTRAPLRNQRQEVPGGAFGDDEDIGNGEPASGSQLAGQAAEDYRAQGHGPNANAPLKIDATAILEQYQDFVWAENVVLDRLAICEMGAKKVVDAEGRVVNEVYDEVASVKLPGIA